jgi:hypothetical protein
VSDNQLQLGTDRRRCARRRKRLNVWRGGADALAIGPCLVTRRVRPGPFGFPALAGSIEQDPPYIPYTRRRRTIVTGHAVVDRAQNCRGDRRTVRRTESVRLVPLPTRSLHAKAQGVRDLNRPLPCRRSSTCGWRCRRSTNRSPRCS